MNTDFQDLLIFINLWDKLDEALYTIVVKRRWEAEVGDNWWEVVQYVLMGKTIRICIISKASTER